MYTRGPKQLNNPNRASSNTRCQRCLKLGHFTYECSNSRPYAPRPSHSKQLASGAFKRDQPTIQVPEEFKTNAGVGLADKILKAKEEERRKVQVGEERKTLKSGKGKIDGSSPSSEFSEGESDSDSAATSSSGHPSEGRKRGVVTKAGGAKSRSPSPQRRRRRYSDSSDSASSPPRTRRVAREPSDRSRSPVRRPDARRNAATSTSPNRRRRATSSPE